MNLFNRLGLLRIIMLIILLTTGIFCFIKYSSKMFITPKDFFFEKCCSKINSKINCTLTYYCKKYLENWKNTNSNKKLIL